LSRSSTRHFFFFSAQRVETALHFPRQQLFTGHREGHAAQIPHLGAVKALPAGISCQSGQVEHRHSRFFKAFAPLLCCAPLKAGSCQRRRLNSRQVKRRDKKRRVPVRPVKRRDHAEPLVKLR
jgi:hypothetical protein